MGKKIFKIFIVGFFKAILVLGCMILAAVGGFYGTKKYYTVKNQKARESEAKEMISGAKVDTVSRNLIFSYNSDKNTISNAVLEVYDTENQVMSYVTIPTSVEVTIPANMYRKLLAVNQEIPQIFKFYKLPKYFDKNDDTKYGYGAIIMASMLDVDISYYTVVDKSVFDQAFDLQKSSIKNNGMIKGFDYSGVTTTAAADDSVPSGDDPYAHDDSFVSASSGVTSNTPTNDSTSGGGLSKIVNVAVLKDTYMAQFDAVKGDEVEFTDFMTETVMPSYMSNLDSADKLSYVENYMSLQTFDYYAVPGSYYDKVYVIDSDKAAKLFKKLGVPKSTEGEDYTEEEVVESVPEVSSVQVLNGSGVQGVAAKWQTNLANNGFNVATIGNYDQRLSDTLIIVKEEGMGQELVKYFSNPTIQVGAVPDGLDATVVIGMNDANVQ